MSADPGDDLDRRRWLPRRRPSWRWRRGRGGQRSFGSASAARSGSISRRSTARPGARRRRRRSTRILPQPFERTAINGFGFLQIVRPRAPRSLVELAQAARVRGPGAAAAGGVRAAGAKRLVAHPALAALLAARPDWLDALAAAGRRRRRLACRRAAPHLGRLCRSRLKANRCPLCGKPDVAEHAPFAAAAARTATCCNGWATAIASPGPPRRSFGGAGQRRPRRLGDALFPDPRIGFFAR